MYATWILSDRPEVKLGYSWNKSSERGKVKKMEWNRIKCTSQDINRKTEGHTGTNA